MFTCDVKMLRRRGERVAITQNDVGVVALTSGEEHPNNVAQLIATNWSRLEELHLNTPRPFAFYLTPDGQFQEVFNGQNFQGFIEQ